MRGSIIIILLIVLTSKLIWSINQFSIEKNFNSANRKGKSVPSYLEDADLTTDQLISKNNYTAETHYVTTDDGYILCIHRITNSGRQPVLLFHGLVDSSASYVIMGPENSLGYMLWHNGYDVCLGNSRGNRYSKNHTTLSPENETFWNFSFHEMGVYDVPATIDYILSITGFTQLHYIGHSQGTTMFFVMCTKKPSYNEKIFLMQALAPAVYLTHLKSPVVPPLEFIISVVLQQYNGEIFSNEFIKQSPCFNGKEVTALCIELLYWLFGHTDQFNTTLAPMILSHAPAGSSTKAFRHFFQVKNSAKFLEYDYGSSENMKRYGTDQPPKYNLSSVTAPVVIHFSSNDYLIEPVDVHQLSKELKNIQGVHRVKVKKFNHVDFTWSINVKSLVNQKLMKVIRQFEEGTSVYVVD